VIAVLREGIFILSGARTPIGRFRGSLADFSAPRLGAKAIDAALRKAAIPHAQVEMVTLGCVVASGLGEAPAKQAALIAGIPPSVHFRTVETVCASSLEAVFITADALSLGRVDLAIAGGMESRTNAPYFLEPRYYRSAGPYAKGDRLLVKKIGAYRWTYGEDVLGQAEASGFVDATAYDGLFWPPQKKFMRDYALAFAKKHKISLEEVNSGAASSHEKALAAQLRGYFKEEIVPCENVYQDELPAASELEEMKKEARSDMACSYNTSSPADNGSAVVLCSRRFAAEHSCKPLARILGFSRIDTPAEDFLDSPVTAVGSLLAALDRAGYSEKKFEILELNEAFGIQLPLFARSFPEKKINVNGGAIALGHPLGSGGTRLLVTLLQAMKRLHIRRGIAAICFGGGGASAIAIELADQKR
jgi:acetyl-CoA C-acetyltransferase